MLNLEVDSIPSGGSPWMAGENSLSSEAQPSDDGLQCLLMVAALHGIAADAAQLRHEFGKDRFDESIILRAAKKLRLKARLVSVGSDRLDRVALPAIGIDREGRYFVLARLESNPSGMRALIQRPAQAPQVVDGGGLLSCWSGRLLLFAARGTYAEEFKPFDFSWFLPSVIKYRRLFGEVLLISLTLQLIALATPLFFQVVMDKVLVSHAVETLDVVAAGLLIAILFEAALATVRSYVFSHTTSKIDVELGTRLFRHLLHLPVSYFQSRRVGDSIARVRELENIRTFLTGNALTVVLDLLFSVFFLGVMLFYSARLTLVVLTSIPIYAALSFILTPTLRAKLNDKFNRGAESQAFLVETVSGIDTVKAMAVEPRWSSRWEGILAAYVRAGLSATNAGLVAGGAVRLVSKLVTLVLMWMGAWQVMGGHLTVGELIAFNMLATQVSQPVLRLAQLWNDFQQVGISMRRLGDLLNTRTEIVGRRTELPRLRGAIEFQGVTFRYKPDAPPALREVSFRIEPGEVIGVVGRSGSGKSTATKLIQRLYLPESGTILIDRHDLATADAASLRRQIGVVPQDGTLFGRSIRENISIANPSAPLEAVIEVARMAGAHEFICALPEGYDTQIGEHGTGLSGGQRQRIAIARSLLHDPRILIFDEATSALDYESEQAIHDSMARICQGRTVLIVAHRLSAVRHADRLLVLERGQVVESGSHSELIARNGIYAQLHRLQLDGARGPVT